MPEFQINYLAVGASALATIFIGALWYSPLFVSQILGEGSRILGRKGRADAKDGRPSLHGVTVLLFSDGLRSRGARFLHRCVDSVAGVLSRVSCVDRISGHARSDCPYVLRETVLDLPHRC